jgi:SM-20-related protein
MSANDQVHVKEIKVTLLLSGGHQQTLFLKPEDPLLGSLYAAAYEQAQNRSPQELFQVGIDRGRSSLCFAAQHLTGIITEPPMLIKQQGQQMQARSAVADEILPSHFVQIKNFLSHEEHRQLLDYVVAREQDFAHTITEINKHPGYRKSKAIYEFPEFSELMRERVRACVPEMQREFGLDAFAIDTIECQLTAHNENDYYKMHNDNGSDKTASRELTYVHYFHREPKAFSGGQLKLYDSIIENNYYVEAETYKTVAPLNNSMVFFLARYMHEVMPVQCPSRQFADGRFTINGWVRRKNTQ